jgi:hypothetical protein
MRRIRRAGGRLIWARKAGSDLTRGSACDRLRNAVACRGSSSDQAKWGNDNGVGGTQARTEEGRRGTRSVPLSFLCIWKDLVSM